MMKSSTDSIHSCLKCYGKAVHIMIDGNHHLYCGYCNALLKDSQVDEGVLRRLGK